MQSGRTVTTVRTGAVTTRTTQHDLSLNGRAGAIFILILVCLVTFIIAFATPGWLKYSFYDYYPSNAATHGGLWEQCRTFGKAGGSHLATQILMCLALVGLVVAVILIFLYLFVHTVSKYQVLLGLVIDSFITFVLMLVGVIVFGTSFSHLYWSYAVAVISTILCLAAAIVAAIQLARC